MHGRVNFMTRDEADYIVVRYSRHIGGKVARLNEADLAGFDWPGGQMYFEYVSPIGSLVCRAKVFKFRGTVNPRIMFLLEAAVRSGEDTGGGALEFHEPSSGIYLTLTYTEASKPFAEIADGLDRLAQAGETWIRVTLRKILAAASP